ncbi:MAG TPA: VCBS repeat-containing protein, partial [Phycisphaerales bacterium]|nr:VCBS repeat-containing protein [Phycisphaerales bacterium]
LNNGDGTFSSRTRYAVGAGPASIALGDLNGDGALDMVVSNAGNGDVSVLLNQCSAPPCPADLNGDGLQDLADISTFVLGFTGQDPVADLAEPFGVFDLADITAFISAFNAGCP